MCEEKIIKKYNKIQRIVIKEALNDLFSQPLTEEHQKFFYLFLKTRHQRHTNSANLVNKVIKPQIKEIRSEIPDDFIQLDYNKLIKLYSDLKTAGLIEKIRPEGRTKGKKIITPARIFVTFEEAEMTSVENILPISLKMVVAGLSNKNLILNKEGKEMMLEWDEVELLLRSKFLNKESTLYEESSKFFKDVLWLFSEEEIQAHLSERKVKQ